MAGLYIHIPFCKQACYYCDFHFSTQLKHREEMVKSMARELEIQQEYLHDDSLKTIYFGGGTPSILDAGEVGFLLDVVNRYFSIEKEVEITLETNPDDVDHGKLMEFKGAGVNRLSLGIQTFHEPHLKLMNRAHSSAEGLNAVKAAQDAGFENLSMDLIFGLPAEDHGIWEHDLNTALGLGVQHISAYGLTIEENTVFGRWTEKGRFKPVSEDYEAVQFEMLMDATTANGFRQYEISNFAIPGYESRHNSGYWKQEKFLGVGPGAFSFDGRDRQFNLRNNARYMKSIGEGVIPAEQIRMDQDERLNEFLLTSLRTIWGCNTREVHARFEVDLLELKKEKIEELVKLDVLQLETDTLFLTRKGRLLADQVASQLFV